MRGSVVSAVYVCAYKCVGDGLTTHTQTPPHNTPQQVPVTKPFPVTTMAALTRLAWSGEGRKLAVGDAEGAVHVLGVDAALVSPRGDEEVRLEEVLRGVLGRGGGAE